MNTDPIKQVQDAIGGFFGSSIVQLGLRAIAVYIVIIWLVTAFWAFRDMQLRTSNPVAPYLAAAFIIAFTPVFFIFGTLIYKMVRPQERIGEAYERGLAEEALLAEIAAIEHCATCSRKVHDDWIICPTCRTRLKRVCPNCSKLVGLEWSLCAWCGRDFERAVAALGSVPVAAAPEAAAERAASGGRVAPKPIRTTATAATQTPRT